MALTLSSGARLRFPDALLLSAALESGRALVESETRDSVKLVTDEAEVRGRGRAVVRRRERATLVTCLSGRFHVASAKGSVSLAPGQGCVALAGRAPSAPGGGARRTERALAGSRPRLRRPGRADRAALERRRARVSARAAAGRERRGAAPARRRRRAGADRDPVARRLSLARVRPRRPRRRRPAFGRGADRRRVAARSPRGIGAQRAGG